MAEFSFADSAAPGNGVSKPDWASAGSEIWEGFSDFASEVSGRMRELGCPVYEGDFSPPDDVNAALLLTFAQSGHARVTAYVRRGFEATSRPEARALLKSNTDAMWAEGHERFPQYFSTRPGSECHPVSVYRVQAPVSLLGRAAQFFASHLRHEATLN